MIKPIAKYKYYECVVENYDDWAEQAYNKGDCRIKLEYAQQLVRIYEEFEYTDNQHSANIAFLDKLQYELNFVWDYRAREESGMVNLVQDYKDYFGIK